MDELPNVTAHLVVPAIGMGGLLYGLILAWVSTILGRRFHRLASFFPQTLMLAPVSAKTVATLLLTMTCFLCSLTGVAWLVWISMGDSEDVDVGGPLTSISNYRPISLLSVFNKLLEKLMSSRLLDFIQKKGILFENQFGFRTNYSTDHVVLTIIDKIQTAIDARDYTCGIFLDLSKAFDTVNHSILIRKLEHYGIRGVANNWFTSYLNARRQTVTINNIISSEKNISCGIPQGSVLGPLLFILYINDLHHCSDFFDFHLFADDANLFSRHKNINTLESSINSELNKVNTWLCSNKLSLNVEKSNFVLFHPIQRKISSNFVLTINNNNISRCMFVKYLGILIDSNLSWKSHIDSICKKIKRSIGMLSKLRYYVPLKILVNLYYTLIYPFLTYGLIVWGNTYSTALQPLFILQKKAMRIVTFSKYCDHSSPLFKRLKIIKLYDLITLHVSCFMYKYYHKLLPPVFNDFFIDVHAVHNYNTRLSSKKSYYLPKARTNYGLFNIRFLGTKTWNNIDETVKLFSFHKFKKRLKDGYIDQY